MKLTNLRRFAITSCLTLTGLSSLAIAGNDYATVEKVDVEAQQLTVFNQLGELQVFQYDGNTVFSSGGQNIIAASMLIPSETVSLSFNNNETLKSVNVDTTYTNQADVIRERKLSALHRTGVLLSSQ